jgi:hypothetical protein
MFEYGSGKSAFGHSPWFYILFGVAVVYAILAIFPETERLADLVGALLAGVVAAIIYKAVRNSVKG